MTATSRDYSELRDRLVAEKARLTDEIHSLERGVRDSADSLADEGGGYGNHMADDAGDTFEAERELTLQRNLEDVLADVETALARMDEGKYGVCVDCGREIPIERLEARPYSIRCVADQQKDDQRR